MQAGARNPSRHDRVVTTARPRVWLTLLSILALFFQAYIAQTHIHIPTVGDALRVSQSTVSTDANKAGVPYQAPQEDQGKCPLCQIAITASAVLGPLAYYLVLPLAQGEVLALRELPQPKALSPAHVWNSRGPPRL